MTANPLSHNPRPRGASGRPPAWRLGAAFLADAGGATAVWFGLVVIVLVILALGAIDMGRAMTERTRLQDSLDAATLIVARGGTLTSAQMDAVGDQALNVQFKTTTGASATSSFAAGADNSVIGTAQASFDPIILGLFTGDRLTVRAATTVKRGKPVPLELALVLDTTGSMAGAKIAALKTAATNLVSTLTGDPSADVKIAVVPFAQYVNVGVSRRNEPWLIVPADYSTTSTPTCTTITTKTTCQTQTYSCTRYNDGVPYQSTCTRSYNCVTTALDPPVTSCPAPTTTYHRWYGCVGSPPYPKNVTDNDPSRRYPGFLDITCAAELLPLTTNASSVKSTISGLSASGNTYIPSGLAWGFNVLSSPVPFTEAKPYDPSGANSQPHKTLVLMTDGENTKLMNAATGDHNISPPGNSTATQANTYTSELCANIKAQKIEVYTIAFNVTDNQIKTILKGCASRDDHYFDAADTAALNAAFATIADALRTIYISR